MIRYAVWLALLAVSPAATLDSLAAQAPSGTQAAWTRVATGGETQCALDTPYSFFFREGTAPDKLLIYFEGGGACWDWVSCSGTFDSNVAADEPVEFRGIFNRSDSRNPLRSYSAVFVPYCTADVHIGDASVTYGAAGSRPIAHRGFRNVSAVLAWIAARGLHPTTVVVAGTSAGSYGALFYMRPIARLFPNSRLVLLGDSGVPLLSKNAEILKRWGADAVMDKLWEGESGPRTLLEAYRQAARAGPHAQLAEITTDHDVVQSGFYLISGSPEWRRATYSLLADAKVMVPSLRTYIMAGGQHGLLHTDAFYTYTVDDVPLHMWVSRLLAGEEVADVRCAACVP